MPQENSFEAKFGQIADAVIYDRSPMLAKWKVGFQTLDKDEEETKAAGVMAFKIGKQWAYVPAFWLDGKLKGTNLLYLRQQDVFCPNKESWINYVLAKLPAIVGEGVDLERGAKGGAKGQADTSFDLEFGANKEASWAVRGSLDLVRPIDKEAMMAHPVTGSVDLVEWLPKLGKEACMAFAHALAGNQKLALAVSRHYDPVELAHTLVDAVGGGEAKEAKSRLRVVTSPLDKEAAFLSPAQREKLAEEGIIVMEDTPSVGTVHEEEVRSDSYGSPEGPGLYDVLLRDGNMEPMMLAGPLSFVKQKDADACLSYPSYKSITTDSPAGKLGGSVYVVIDGKYKGGMVLGAAATCRKAGAFELPSGAADMESLRAADAERKFYVATGDGEVYMIESLGMNSFKLLSASLMDDDGKWYSPTFESEKVEIKTSGRPGRMAYANGVLWLPSTGVGVFKYRTGHGQPRPKVDGEINNNIEDGNPLVPLGQVSDIRDLVEKEGYSKVKVYTSGHGQWSLSGVRGMVEGLGKAAAVRELVGGYGVKADLAITILDKEATSAASSKSPSATRYLVESKYISKRAYGEEEAVDETQEVQSPPSHENDLVDAEVEDIFEKSESGVKEVMDVSILKALAKRSDIEDMVGSFVSDLIRAMDRAGRLLFLFYWNNDQFVELYGRQEMYELETSLSDVFEGLSSLVLFLNARKARSAALGSSDDGGLEGGLGGF